MERFVYMHRTASIRQLARRFQITEARCRDELEVLEAYGVEVDAEGTVRVPEGV
jgi:hypothetical protein